MVTQSQFAIDKCEVGAFIRWVGLGILILRQKISDAQVLAESKMVECDGLCAMDKPEAFAEGDGAHIMGTNGDKWGEYDYISVCELNVCFPTVASYGTNSLNPLLQDLRGKSRSISAIRYN